jgi:hypothetical protein
LSKPRFLARLTDENAQIDVPNPDGFLVPASAAAIDLVGPMMCASGRRG